jgi:hypothetical protein
VGFLHWRGWDRLDDLDRRVGINRQPRTRSQRVRSVRAMGFVWVLLGLTQAALNLEREAWLLTCIALAVVIAALFTVVWATRQLRRIA